jgi:hypothetical protein
MKQQVKNKTAVRHRRLAMEGTVKKFDIIGTAKADIEHALSYVGIHGVLELLEGCFDEDYFPPLFKDELKRFRTELLRKAIDSGCGPDNVDMF